MKTTFRRFFGNGTLDENLHIKHITRVHRWFMLRATRCGISDLIFRTRSRTNTMTRRKKAQVMPNLEQSDGERYDSERVVSEGRAWWWWSRRARLYQFFDELLIPCRLLPRVSPFSPLSYMHESANFFRGRTPVRKIESPTTHTALCAFFDALNVDPSNEKKDSSWNCNIQDTIDPCRSNNMSAYTSLMQSI